jgi:hypothetical protein
MQRTASIPWLVLLGIDYTAQDAEHYTYFACDECQLPGGCTHRGAGV